MKYEIVNPSDKCYLTADNDKIAYFCTFLLGNGFYICKDENGNQVGKIWVFDPTLEALDEDFDGDFKKFSETHMKEIAECFESFEYDGEQTSLNDIGKRAKEFAKAYRRFME